MIVTQEQGAMPPEDPVVENVATPGEHWISVEESI
jgi:hypothetical protein